MICSGGGYGVVWVGIIPSGSTVGITNIEVMGVRGGTLEDKSVGTALAACEVDAVIDRERSGIELPISVES